MTTWQEHALDAIEKIENELENSKAIKVKSGWRMILGKETFGLVKKGPELIRKIIHTLENAELDLAKVKAKLAASEEDLKTAQEHILELEKQKNPIMVWEPITPYTWTTDIDPGTKTWSGCDTISGDSVEITTSGTANYANGNVFNTCSTFGSEIK